MIAEMAGVTQPVVSKILHGGEYNIRVSDETRERVLKIAAKSGYRTNMAAKAMRTGRFDSVALLLSSHSRRSILPRALFENLLECLEGRGYHMTIARLPDEQLVSEGFVPKILKNWCADGLLINYNAFIPEKLIQLIYEHEIPSVWINSKQMLNAVYPDDVHGGYLATKRLIDYGHRKIAFLNFTGWGHFSAKDRYEGYRRAMVEAGMEPILHQTEGLPPRSEPSYARDMLSRREVTAVLGYVSNEAWHTYHAAKGLGMRVPEDISIIAFSDLPLVNVPIRISTAIVPEATIAQRAVELLLSHLNGADPSPAIAIQYETITGDETIARLPGADPTT
jgi:LacI family transcriptional regulator